ncbi:hypothetical protein RI129_006395 [Pyrocoelia pectoralis]|uniref:Dynein heavy chain 12, axonemal n=1 Tax=Pyrocoelia pectoralis TaxID=417401 RepID=A0AAN7ZG60_9COLE
MPIRKRRDSVPKPNKYPDINDVISTVFGENITATLKEFGHRRGKYAKRFEKEAERTKLESEEVRTEYPTISKKITPHETMYNLALSLPTTPNTKYLDRAIWKKLSCKGLEKVHQACFWKLVEEVRAEFVNSTHHIGVVCVVKPPNDSIEGHRNISPYKCGGRTTSYNNFLKTVDKLNTRLLITCPLMRNILKMCVQDLPQCLLTLSVFRDRSYDITELYPIFDEEIKKAGEVIRMWYKHVVNYVQKQSKFSRKLGVAVYSCGTTLMGTFLTKSIKTTIEHILEITESGENVPFITMDMRYEKKIILQPPLLKICHLYLQLVGKIVRIGKNLPSLESLYFPQFELVSIPIFVNTDVQDYYERRLKYNIIALFAPINLYVKTLNAEFACVYSEQEKWNKESLNQTEDSADISISPMEDDHNISRKESVFNSGISGFLRSGSIADASTQDSMVERIRRESSIFARRLSVLPQASNDMTKLFEELEGGDDANEESLKEDITFEEGYAKVEVYRSYLDKLAVMIDIEDYLVAQLVQSSCRDAICNALSDMIEKVARKIASQHTWLNEDICEQFEMVKVRALTLPQSSEELMEQGAYMLWAATDHLNDLTERLQLSMSVICNLAEMTTLTREHIELNSKTMKWIHDIKPIIEKNAFIFESAKSEFDERLQKAVVTLNGSIEAFFPLLDFLNDMDDAANSRAYILQLAPLMAKVRDFNNLLTWINKEELVFKVALTECVDLKAIQQHLYPFYRLVKVCFTIVRKMDVWSYGPFEFLDFSEAEAIIDDCLKELQKTQKAYKSKIKQSNQENIYLKFRGNVDELNIIKQPAPMKLCAKALQMIKEFRPTLNMMNIMCNDALLQRHWDDMSEIAGFDITPDAGTTLAKFMNMGIIDEIDKYEVISSGAIKERQLLENLVKMQGEWENVMFKTSAFKDTGINILTALDDIQAILDEQIVKTLTMRGSVFVKPYATQVGGWYETITRVNSTLEEWAKVQAQWLYLLPIFSSKDIVSQMPEEGQMFKEVDGIYRRYLNLIVREPKVIDSAPQPGLLENMQLCTKILDRINEGVTAYLEKKRVYFPRFFFLSNDEMLEILSETKDPLRVQPHLKKCFEGINCLEFDKALKIHAMFSGEGEKIYLLEIIDTVAARGSVEKWLLQVEGEMLAAVQDQIAHSWLAYQETYRTEWVTQWPGQVVLAVSQIFWTLDMHQALNASSRSAFTDLLKQLKLDLNEIVTLVRSTTITNLARITIKALIVIDVHAKDVAEDLYDKNVKNDTEFKWLAQLRYYWEERCMVRIINATVKYANEYLGNSDRLVITPLTDRCYRTLVGAYYLHLNGAPEGPAGTGKTETTKDLAKALAVQCVVFNCSDGLDYKAMGKFFKGLAAAGAWVCFDEFNRIDVEVLSVVAQQILCIVIAVRTHAEKFMFEGTELRLNPGCYVCITMNPGYAGRSELPDNLKVLFRTVAMMVPDYAMIGEISLYSYGFVDARKLSVKIVTVYRLCSEQLSSQNHYDYGMRAVKSVLSACGNNKRKYPDENEDILLLKSILDVNLAKFLAHDVPLFEGIISDLFPGIVLPEVDYSSLVNCIQISCESRNLQMKPCVILKIIQTYEMMIVRHGFMLVGEPFAGKTMTLKVLSETLTLLSEQGENQLPVKYQFINPKSITMGQLYGQFDPVSYEWFDGVVATCFRTFVMDTSPDRKWVIFDGPVDAVWIENMNTVLDDNKKLCLMSGEVMAMTNVMSMIFEVMDLSQASPATVSRCGMIYMEPSTLGWRPHVESWIPTCSTEWVSMHEAYTLAMFDWVVSPCLYFIRKFCKQLCSSGEINLVKNMMQIMNMLLTDGCRESTRKEDDFKFMRNWIQGASIVGMAWGLGSILDTASRAKFDEFCKILLRGEDNENPYPPIVDKLEIQLPTDGILFDYSFIFRSKGSWKYWPDIAKNLRVDEASNIQQAMIPTVDTVKYMIMIELHIKYHLPVVLIGPTGTGKSYYMQDLLMNRLNQEMYEPAFVTFTVKISANQTQDLVVSKLLKRRRGHYGPPLGKLCVIFVDDMNMPVKEIYGAQPPIELLRQYFDHKNWYDIKDTSPLYLHDILITGAMGPPGGSRQEVYARFLRHFSIFSINEFSEDTMSKIYSNVLLLGWKNNGFPSDIFNVVQQVVNATLDIYKAAIQNLLPTPAKSHYIFNLRDFSRIVCGCAMLRKESAENKTIFSKIWTHEVLRVMYDRLVDDNDKSWLFNKIKTSVKSFFKEQFEQVFESLKDQSGQITEACLQNLMFGTYLDTEATEEDVKYEEVVNAETFLNVAQTSLDEYNSTHKTKMDIVLFKYALEHLSKICRILAMPSGSALLVGVSGSGRQSLTKVATTITGHSFFQPEITKNYGMNEWRDDLKKVVKEAGGKGKQTVFLFTEGQIKEEGFLQDIDGLLNAGEVPNIFQIEEKQEVMELCRLAAQGGNRNMDISALAVFSFFIKRTREKLHIVLCFSPIGSSFRLRLRLYPSLVNCCTIDWFEDWPEEALEMVAQNWMGDVNLDDDVKNSAIISCKYFHVSARKIAVEFFAETSRKSYITSASYLELIKIFTELTNKKQKELLIARSRYVVGLEKLQFAAEQIFEMQINLEALQPELKVMSAKATQMMDQIARETIEVERASGLVRKDEEAANAQAAEAQALKAECEADLALAIPILEEATAALNTLKPADITLVKAMKNPPETVKLVMAGVCVIKDVKPDRINDPASGKKILDYWGPSKRILGDMNFLQSLKDFDKDNIKVEVMTTIRKEFLPHKDFKPEIVAKASSAAEGLCKWIIAMDMYDKVAKVVGPKKAKLNQAEQEYSATMAILFEKKSQVAKLEEKLANLNEMLAEATEKKQNLQDTVDLCANKLIRANQLIGGLGGEKTRWTIAANGLQKLYDSLAGDILLSCGMIAYLSPFTMQWRLNALEDWFNFVGSMNIPTSPTYDFAATLGSEIKIQDWYIAGLPRDAFSTGNAIIQDNSKRWSLLIDPQTQANLWIKKMEKKNDIRVTKFSDGNYMKVLEYCVEFGKPALVENIREDLEAPLDPLLYKSTFRQAGMNVIALGENVIPYHRNFKLYLTSKMRNPHYLPEVFNKVTIINFALTIAGLEDQLLGIVVAKERPDLQRKREELIIEGAENKTALANIEEMILRTLSESQGDILEDESAIRILDQSKAISIDIMNKQVVAKETEEKIDLFRLDYKPVATHSAGLYYCISDLPNIDPMYQYSLGWFINLYINSIDTASKSRELNKRIGYLQDNFTYNLYANVCRSLFEKDKLMFSFLLCVKIMLSKNKIDEREYTFLITGGIDVDNPIPNPSSGWLSAKSWNEICRLDSVTVFDGFRNSVVENISAWQALYDLVEPQNSTIPSPWDKKLTSFQKLLVIRALRPDKITVSISKYVSEEMGTKFIIPPPFDIAKSYEESSCVCPLVFILSAGTDPMSALQKFADAKGFSDKLKCISLGQGQGPIAQALVEQGQDEGSWVCLQNCHLAVSWMVPLEKLWESLDFSNTHSNFRLWLTSYPSDKFPVTILQNGAKMTNEPPTGLQQNLLRSYINDPLKNEEFYLGCPGRDLMFARLLYGIAFFHAVIQERRSFGPMGWNIPYGFNESDFDISVQQLRMFVNEYKDDPYEGVCYLTGECNYGGRVTDDWDRRLIVTILQHYLNPKVVNELKYSFSDVANCYTIPKKPDYDEFIAHITSLPQFHPPEVYGLHSNAGITRDLQISYSLLNGLILLQGEGSSGSGDEDVFINLVTSDLLLKLPKNFDLEAAKYKYPVRYEESMNTVLVQEMERFTKLLNEIRNSLQNIQKAIKGLVVMTPALELLQGSLLLGRIPAAWAKVSYPSLKSLPNYISDFVDRINFLDDWYKYGKPKNFWLSGFFFTQAFLTGAKQNYARKYAIPIDQLTFDFDVLKVRETNYAPEDGIYVYGLYTDGARWDIERVVLAELYPKILYDYMPLIWLTPITISQYSETGRYKCPLYKTSERRGILSTTGHSTNYVLPFLLNTDQPASHWIKRSVALLCQLS